MIETPNVKPNLETTGITMPRMAAFYDALVWVLSLGRERRLRLKMLELAELAEGQRVLDVGCGTGTLALLAKEAVGPAGEVLGVDATPQMIRRARKKARRRAADVRFDEGLVEALPVSDASFDVVLTTFTMHHFPGDLQARALAEMLRVLVPGGRLLIVDFAGHGHGASAHRGGSGAEDGSGDQLVDVVERAEFAEIDSGELGMLKAVYVVGRKPTKAGD